MLSYLKLKNFKSFSNITLDLRGSHGIPKKMAFIYGENGAGKSNLMSSLLFLGETLDTLVQQESAKQSKILGLDEWKELGIEDGAETKRNIIENLIQKLQNNTNLLSNLIKNNKSIGSNENMSIEIGFRINGRNGMYYLEFDDKKVVSEKLIYYINRRNGVIYSIEDDKFFLSPSTFLDSVYNIELSNDISKFWGKHTFMSILFYENLTKNEEYINSRIASNVFQVLEWLHTYSVLCQNNRGQRGRVAILFDFLHSLDSGIVDSEDDKELKIFEKALNSFFTVLYSDIKGVYYKITPMKDSYQYELTFRKKVGGKILDIPISLESTGTKKLLDIFPYIFTAIDGETVFIDEIDSGIHDLLISTIIKHLQEQGISLQGQFIATTHNTLLMEELDRESVYILQSDINGNKELSCVAEYSFRTQKSNSIRKKYLNGDYEGIPYVGFLDLQEIVDDVKEEMSSYKK